ncbi:MAG: methylenetetrahydrofolate--tRNA-(uracil(54)-C(5))-methyltransferase (FADH(2)-oxidizing) TrmFO [candidate division WOR-3 bacterium]
MPEVTVIGAGLAGCEAALQCARFGVRVRLFEMRPLKMTPAHKTGDVAELVCSNSLKSDEPHNAHGLLKAELRIFGSVLLECAQRAWIPGGKALVVDRRRFSEEVQSALAQAGIVVERHEVTELPANLTIVATGPLTSDALARELTRLLGAERLFFYDAIAPIVAADSLDMSRIFAASRYGRGADYLNCPLTEEEYDRFVTELVRAELHPLHNFEETRFFEGCLPVEELARRGRLALAFGPMKPVGLVDPKTGKRPFAVVQLRKENEAGTMFNLVGFQTRLKHPEQERVFRLIPGLEQAVFLRYGSIHRNTFLDSPRVLLATLQPRIRPDLLIAGQLTGVEGYVESIATGLVAGVNAARLALDKEPIYFPTETMLGSLLRYITTPNPDFQPMNANFGLLPPIEGPGRRQALVERALTAARAMLAARTDLPGLTESPV